MCEKCSERENPNKENLRKWVEALRSGKYVQGTGTNYNAKSDTYCCLGVACHVAEENGVDPYSTNFSTPHTGGHSPGVRRRACPDLKGQPPVCGVVHARCKPAASDSSVPECTVTQSPLDRTHWSPSCLVSCTASEASPPTIPGG